MKPGRFLLLLLIVTVIAAAAVWLTGCGQNQSASPDENLKTEQPAGSGDVQDPETDVQNPDTDAQGSDASAQSTDRNVQNPGAQSTDTGDDRLSEQENDGLIDGMLGTLTELEETVDSLDDVSDEDLQFPE